MSVYHRSVPSQSGPYLPFMSYLAAHFTKAARKKFQFEYATRALPREVYQTVKYLEPKLATVTLRRRVNIAGLNLSALSKAQDAVTMRKMYTIH